MKAASAKALASSDEDRNTIDSEGAFDQDRADIAMGWEKEMHRRWLDQIEPIMGYRPSSPPSYGRELRDEMRENRPAFHETLPLASPDSVRRVAAILAEIEQTDEYLLALGKFIDELYQYFGSEPGSLLKGWSPMLTTDMSADDARMFIQYGGFPKVAPVKDSPEFRMEVEALKVRWAGCNFTNPADPYRVLTEVVETAHAEFQTELGQQAGPRNDIVAAQIQTGRQMRAAYDAMVESLGQAWVADRIRQKLEPGNYLSPEQRARVEPELANIRSNITRQAEIAKNAVAIVKTQVEKVSAAKEKAARIAEAAHHPRGRGLMYAQQSAQVTLAMTAATEAAAGATNTTLEAVRAAGATRKALYERAQAESHALDAQYRRVAAQDAAWAARYAAEGAEYEAGQAAKEAVKAKEARIRAENAEAAAKAAAAVAKAKKVIAERERANAAEARARADAERIKAKNAEAEAARQQNVAAGARQQADTAGQAAHDKRVGAEEAERQAKQARDEVFFADRKRDALIAEADALEAAADADKDSGAARKAATDARSAADVATTAAGKARGAADEATAAATAARAAATEAAGAAARAKAAADGAAAAAATTKAQVAVAHAAAADAIDASRSAADNVKKAEELANAAATAVAKARTEAAAARTEAAATLAASARAAGWSFAASQNAFAARDAAAAVADSANTAIGLGSPYRQTDTSAGMAVIVGQSANTMAQQQAVAAQARAEEAAKASEAANAAVGRADADAKVAAEAVAEAAAGAAKAAKSVQQARASAATAATEAAAALRAEANTAEYNRQAQQDAAEAAGFARDASADATAADAAATAAEKDAAAARSSADSAEAHAAAARDTAAKAEIDATAAEQAAKKAEMSAQEAQEDAEVAEAEAEAKAVAASLRGTGPVGVDGVLTMPDIQSHVTPVGPCIIPWDNWKYCDQKLVHKVTGKIVYWLQTCPDPSTTDCPGQYSRDYIGTDIVDAPPQERTVRIPVGPIAQKLYGDAAFAMVRDFYECVTGKTDHRATACAWAVGSIVVPYGIGKAVQAIVAARVAIRSGTGIKGALAAVRAAKVPPATVAVLERDAALALAGKCLHSFDGRTLVAMEDGSYKAINQIRVGDKVYGADPRNKRRTVIGSVSRLFRHNDTELTDVTVRDANGRTAVVHTTPHHRFWSETQHTWVTAANLKINSTLRTLSNGRATVVKVRSFPRSQVMYDFTVKHVHSFFVRAGGASVLVHNMTPCKGVVGYGSEVLSRMAFAHRMKKGVKPGQNVAVFEYETGAGPGYVVAHNVPKTRYADGFHSEQVIDDYLKSVGIKPESVTRIYSERVPCAKVGHECALLVKGYRNAELSWSFNELGSGAKAALARAMERGIG